MIYCPRQEEGQGLVEYAMLIILIGVVVIVVAAALGPTIGNMYQNILDAMEGAGF